MMGHDPKLTTFGWVYAFVMITGCRLWRIVNSAKGRTLIAVREDENRRRRRRHRHDPLRVFAFIVGLFFAGVGGALSRHMSYLVPPAGVRLPPLVELVVIGHARRTREHQRRDRHRRRLTLLAGAAARLRRVADDSVFAAADRHDARAPARFTRQPRDLALPPRTSQTRPPAANQGARQCRSLKRKTSPCSSAVARARDFNFTLDQGDSSASSAQRRGKTTAFNVVTGVYPPTSGDVILNNKSIAGLPTFRINRAGLARTFQNIRLFAGLTVLENVLVAIDQSSGHDLLGTILRSPKHLSANASTRRAH
jgi:uncharacterized iron-regulated membrane protein